MVSKLKINASDLGSGKVILNGKDISNIVSGLTIVINAGKMPEVTIRTLTEVLEAELEANVKIEKPLKGGYEK